MSPIGHILKNQVLLLKTLNFFSVLTHIEYMIQSKNNVMSQISVNYPIPGLSTGQTIVSSEMIQLYPKTLARTMQKSRKNLN